MHRGIERFSYDLANHLVRNFDMEIIIYSWSIHNKVEWGEWDDKIKHRFVPYIKYYQKFIAKLFYYFWIKIDKPDGFIINFLYHGESMLSNSKNIYYVLHAPASLIKKRYLYINHRSKSFKQLSYIAVSQFVKDEAKSYIQQNKIKVIHNGIDISRFNINREYENNDKIKILTVSALEDWKGIQNVISLFLDDLIKQKFEYHIYGSGPFEKNLKDMVKKHNLDLSIHFYGTVNHIEKIFQDYDVYCQLSDGEAFGFSIFEAMASGLPVIVYDIPPFDILIPSHVAKKVKHKSQKFLKEYLLEFSDVKKRKMIGLAGREYVREKFSLEKMASDYFHHINTNSN